MKIRKAVLLIHGFAGGTYDMESLAWRLEKCLTLDVYEFTLPGHGYRSSDMSNCREWIKCACEKVETLISYGYNDIYVVGHSMGGVIATYVATKYKEIKKVVLAAPAFKYIAEKENFSLKKTNNIINDYGLSEIWFRCLSKLPIHSLNEFVILVKKYQDTPKKVKVPILIFQGLKDDIVPVTSGEYVFNSVKSKEKGLVYLENSNHNIFNGPQQGNVNIRIEKFLLYGTMKEKEYV